MNASLKDRVVIVTGSSSGIGASCALSCVRRGAKVVVCGRNEQRMKDVAEQCATAAGTDVDDVLCVRGDLANAASVQSIVNRTVERFGHIDTLVLCAGYAIPRGTEHTSVADLRELWRLHILAPFLMIKSSLPHLRAAHRPKSTDDGAQSKRSADDVKQSAAYSSNIIFISSLMGFYPMLMTLSYSVTKAAQDHFARLLVSELRPSDKDESRLPIRINSVRPGWIRTPIIEHSGVVGGRFTAEAVFRVFDFMTPAKRCGTSEEVGEYVAFLSTDACQSIIGQNLFIDGAQSVPYCTVARYCTIL